MIFGLSEIQFIGILSYIVMLGAITGASFGIFYRVIKYFI